MTPGGARRGVIVAMFATGALAFFREVQAGDVPRLRIFIGVLFAAVMLAALSDAAPRMAVGLAAMILVSTLITTTTSADTLRGISRAIERD